MPKRPDPEWELDLKPVRLNASSRAVTHTGRARIGAEGSGESLAVAEALTDIQGALQRIEARLTAIEDSLTVAPKRTAAPKSTAAPTSIAVARRKPRVRPGGG